ncbi:MAG: phosphoribosylformylglycinamidine synthase subunit PurL [Candidatus Hydrogenedentota bacterium]
MNATQNKPTRAVKPLWQELGLTRGEYDHIVSLLGREPNETELGIYGVMWSEHCSYKNSRKLLSGLPTTGSHVLQGPGENAGVIALDENLAVCFKIESHNHPSAIEPYQGAATGVGGILRDIFAMGARPIALLDSLHFGDPHERGKCRERPGMAGSVDPESDRVATLVRGVVRGIADYGNCVGIPTVAGETRFDANYLGNPLVNVMAVGIVPRDRIMRARASGIGGRVLYYGGPTGRDGIHGATFSSETFEEGVEDKRSAVQIGDPFMEKKILEATLELIESDAVDAIQDMGAAGLTCSSCEMASRGETGIEIDLARVPLRAARMSPYEIMLSESQERMLAVVSPEKWEKAAAILAKWDMKAHDLGEIKPGRSMVVKRGDEICAEIPVPSLTDAAPLNSPAMREPDNREARLALHLDDIPEPADPGAVLLRLLDSPELCSRAWIWEQYDHMVGTSTALKTIGGDAAVLRVHGSEKAVAVSVDSCARAASLDPKTGAMLAVAESARNVACSGALPVAATNCCNFGNPNRPEIYWQLAQSIEGMSEACRALDTPITGGNVSLYNETDGEAISPTLTIGMLGILDASAHATGIALQAGNLFLIGSGAPSLAASEYLYQEHHRIAGRPAAPDFADERAIQKLLLAGIQGGLIRAAHDVSLGGIAVTLAEMARAGRMGIRVDLPGAERTDVALFGEGPGRVIVVVEEKDEEKIMELARKFATEIRKLGEAGGGELVMKPGIRIPMSEILAAGRDTFTKLFEKRGSR